MTPDAQLLQPLERIVVRRDAFRVPGDLRDARGLLEASSHLTPAEARALAFAARLGPDRPPARRSHPEVIDLDAEEATLAYLARLGR